MINKTSEQACECGVLGGLPIVVDYQFSINPENPTVSTKEILSITTSNIEILPFLNVETIQMVKKLVENKLISSQDMFTGDSVRDIIGGAV